MARRFDRRAGTETPSGGDEFAQRRDRCWLAAVSAPLVACSVAPRPGQAGTVEKRRGAGSRPHDERGLRARVRHQGRRSVRSGARSRRVQHLWALGLFDDITVEVEDGPQGGKVLIVKVKERPSLASVTYQDNKVLTRTDDRGAAQGEEDRARHRKAAEPEVRLPTPRPRSAIMLGQKGLSRRRGRAHDRVADAVDRGGDASRSTRAARRGSARSRSSGTRCSQVDRL